MEPLFLLAFGDEEFFIALAMACSEAFFNKPGMWPGVLDFFTREPPKFELGNPTKITENSPVQIRWKIEIGWPPLHMSKRVCSSTKPLDLSTQAHLTIPTHNSLQGRQSRCLRYDRNAR
jgi:hypothetical protein